MPNPIKSVEKKSVYRMLEVIDHGREVYSEDRTYSSRNEALYAFWKRYGDTSRSFPDLSETAAYEYRIELHEGGWGPEIPVTENYAILLVRDGKIVRALRGFDSRLDAEKFFEAIYLP